MAALARFDVSKTLMTNFVRALAMSKGSLCAKVPVCDCCPNFFQVRRRPGPAARGQDAGGGSGRESRGNQPGRPQAPGTRFHSENRYLNSSAPQWHRVQIVLQDCPPNCGGSTLRLYRRRQCPKWPIHRKNRHNSQADCCAARWGIVYLLARDVYADSACRSAISCLV